MILKVIKIGLAFIFTNHIVGNLLLNYTINNCNLNSIHLSVDVKNENAIKLYKNNNFIIDNMKHNIYYMIKTNV